MQKPYTCLDSRAAAVWFLPIQAGLLDPFLELNLVNPFQLVPVTNRGISKQLDQRLEIGL